MDLWRKGKLESKKHGKRGAVMRMSAGSKNVSIVNNIKVSLRRSVDGNPNKNDHC